LKEAGEAGRLGRDEVQLSEEERSMHLETLTWVQTKERLLQIEKAGTKFLNAPTNVQVSRGRGGERKRGRRELKIQKRNPYKLTWEKISLTNGFKKSKKGIKGNFLVLKRQEGGGTVHTITKGMNLIEPAAQRKGCEYNTTEGV